MRKKSAVSVVIGWLVKRQKGELEKVAFLRVSIGRRMKLIYMQVH
jgi:hypothetical protein